MVENPRILAFTIVNDCMAVGSSVDGLTAANEGWRERDSSFHLIKALSHLVTHMKQRALSQSDGESHLHLALTRLAMAAAKEKHEQGRRSKDK